MASFNPGGQATRADYNFVSTFDVHKPSVESLLYKRYGIQTLDSIMDLAGAVKSTNALEYIHFEEDWIMPKIKATNGGAGSAGAAVTFTVVAAADLEINEDASPYIGTPVVKRTMPVRVNDLIDIKPASGNASAGTYIRCIVTTVTAPTGAGNGTFVAVPVDSTEAIPSIASADEIIIVGNAHGEGSTQPVSLQSQILRKINNLQTIRDSHKATGVEQDIVTWVDFVDPATGKTMPRWTVKGEADAYIRFKNYIELQMVTGKHLASNQLADDFVDGTYFTDQPLAMTEGLIEFALGGVVSNYSSLSGFTIADLDALVLELDKNKGSKENLLMCGIALSTQIDRELGDYFKNGAITYGNFTMSSDKAVGFEFNQLSYGGYKFNKKTYNLFNDLQTLGAAGFGYPYEGIIIPSAMQYNSKEGYVPSMRKRYLGNQEMKVTPFDGFSQSSTAEDTVEVRYLAHVGFEGFGQNKFGYIKRA